jgi:hypothetical protein
MDVVEGCAGITSAMAASDETEKQLT